MRKEFFSLTSVKEFSFFPTIYRLPAQKIFIAMNPTKDKLGDKIKSPFLFTRIFEAPPKEMFLQT